MMENFFVGSHVPYIISGQSFFFNQTINLWAYVTRGHCLALVIQIFMVPITLQVSDGQNRFIYGQSCVQESE